MKGLVLILLACLFIPETHAQHTRHLIYLKNKGATTHTLSNPSQYLSARAVARRTKYNIPIDSLDLPVPASYLTQIRNIPGVTILNASRWLNAVVIDTTDANAISAIQALPFVQSSTAIASKAIGNGPEKFSLLNRQVFHSQWRPQGIESDYFNYGNGSFDEIHLHKGEFLHNIGLRGQGMQIAMLDAGYFNYTTLDAFDSIMANGQVLSTWDFVNRETSVVEDHSHGMMCLSTIAANIPGEFIGKAPKASFHLFKTEDIASEYPIEEFNWVCGAERADSAGADILSSSLGYNTFDDPAMDHSYNQLDGNTAMCTRGADIAAKKGLVVVNAVGNYGATPWHFLAAPADADSILAVGAVNTMGLVWSGSGYGPSADGRIKPDVASVGLNALVQGAGNTVGVGTGTSYAAPNMAGLATCLWQGFPEFNNMRIIRAIREAGNIFNNPNDRIGYGIPDMKKAFSNLLIEYATSSATVANCNASIQWQSKDVSVMRYEIERKLPTENSYTKVGEVNAQPGMVLSNHNYTYNSSLNNVQAGTVSFRIRQIIDTASLTFTAIYVDTVDMILASTCTTTGIDDPDPDAGFVGIQPNPVTANSSLVIYTRNPVNELNIVVFDMNGRRVIELKESKGAGKKVISLSTVNLSYGKHVVVVYDRNNLLGKAEFVKNFH